MKIFLIAGKSGTGKDEAAKIIKDYYEQNNKKTIITRFSKYIGVYAKEMIGWNGEEETKPRKFLQDFGQVLRKENERFLIDRMIEDIAIYKNYYDNVVICDVRLINEIETIKNELEDVVSIHILSSYSKRNLTDEEKNHITETELDNYNNFDYIITNDFDKSLKNKVITILEGMK